MIHPLPKYEKKDCHKYIMFAHPSNSLLSLYCRWHTHADRIPQWWWNPPLVSAAGTFTLGFFSPLNSSNRYVGIWYQDISVQTIVWVANRQNPINDSTGILSISKDGALVITAKNSTVVWTSGAVQGNGNFVVTQVNGGRKQNCNMAEFQLPNWYLVARHETGLGPKEWVQPELNLVDEPPPTHPLLLTQCLSAWKVNPSQSSSLVRACSGMVVLGMG